MLDGRYDPALALLIARETAADDGAASAAPAGVPPRLAALALAALVLLPTLCAGLLQ